MDSLVVCKLICDAWKSMDVMEPEQWQWTMASKNKTT